MLREEAIKKHRAMWNWIAEEIVTNERTRKIGTLKRIYIERQGDDRQKCICIIIVIYAHILILIAEDAHYHGLVMLKNISVNMAILIRDCISSVVIYMVVVVVTGNYKPN